MPTLEEVEHEHMFTCGRTQKNETLEPQKKVRRIHTKLSNELLKARYGLHEGTGLLGVTDTREIHISRAHRKDYFCPQGFLNDPDPSLHDVQNFSLYLWWVLGRR